jgi:hypothetical protein
MTTSSKSPALFALGSALLLAFALAPALRAQDTSPSLPLSASFAKSAGDSDAPYVLSLKNESSSEITASATVLLAVAFHADSKARTVTEHVIEPGETWAIADLSQGDRVVVSSKGFAPLQLSVEPPLSAGNAPSLPLSFSFAMAPGAADAPYVLTLTNESASSITASAKVLLAVAFHADSKARMVPDHSIGPGETWTIPDLSKGDRVTVAADGFAPLQISVE